MKQEKAIQVCHVTKQYRLYRHRSDRVREALSFTGKHYHTKFNALDDVSFDVFKGETVGIMGRNGAGKSTLLKIITGVLFPSSGSVSICGSLSSLLELGIGFNPEMTGVENVMFSGLIMGFSRSEMEKRLDDILSFADIGVYANQPVKTYSSGMYVRLAFSVAVIAEPDIMVIDEALAVGDIRFQQKCFRRLREMKELGKTILFVSHDPGAVRSMCDRAIWLKDGKVEAIDKPEIVARNYESFMFYENIAIENDNNCSEKAKVADAEVPIYWIELTGRNSFGNGGAFLRRMAFFHKDSHRHLSSLVGGEDVSLIVDVETEIEVTMPVVGFLINDVHGNHVFGMNTDIIDGTLEPLPAGERIRIQFDFKFPRLANGTYTISPAIADGTLKKHVQLHWVHDAHIIHLLSPDPAASMGYMILPELAGFSVSSIGRRTGGETAQSKGVLE